MTDEKLQEQSDHERRVAQEEEAERTIDDAEAALAGDAVRTDYEKEIEAEESGKRWEKIDAEDPEVMDEERDEPPSAGYIPRTG